MQQLSGQDAMFLHAEIDGLPQHIGGVSIYDQSTAPGGKVRFKEILVEGGVMSRDEVEALDLAARTTVDRAAEEASAMPEPRPRRWPVN